MEILIFVVIVLVVLGLAWLATGLLLSIPGFPAWIVTVIRGIEVLAAAFFICRRMGWL